MGEGTPDTRTVECHRCGRWADRADMAAVRLPGKPGRRYFECPWNCRTPLRPYRFSDRSGL